MANGDSGAVEACIAGYGVLVCSHARRFSHSQADAEDAVRGIFVDLWRSAGRYDPRVAREAAFVTVVARRRLIDRRRQRARRPDTEPMSESPDVASPAPDAEMCSEALQPSRALEMLRPEQRDVLVMSTVHGLTHDEIASSTGIPLGTVKVVAAAPMPPSTNEASARVIELGSRREARPARSAMVVALPWMAAAACVAFAVTAWLARPRPETTLARPFEYRSPVVMPSAAPNPNAPDGLDPAAACAELLRTATDVVQVAWSAGEDPRDAQASGDVVWSAKEQRGYMRFDGVASNDPKTLQYQLWVFDAERDDRFPVDGGLFHVVAGEVVIPIRGKLDVARAKLFAVTAEKPGGVVVAKRERLVVTAAVKTG